MNDKRAGDTPDTGTDEEHVDTSPEGTRDDVESDPGTNAGESDWSSEGGATESGPAENS